jgi:uncharacterized protein (DUF1778 family)
MHQQVTSIRLPDASRVRIDVAAQLRGVTRSAFIRDAALERAEQDLERLGRCRTRQRENREDE